jgi:hypothetical protein
MRKEKLRRFLLGRDREYSICKTNHRLPNADVKRRLTKAGLEFYRKFKAKVKEQIEEWEDIKIPLFTSLDEVEIDCIKLRAESLLLRLEIEEEIKKL